MNQSLRTLTDLSRRLNLKLSEHLAAPSVGRAMIKFLLWLILAIISLPLAVLALILYPVFWLLSLPFRLVGISVSAVLDLIGAIIRLPARLLRGRKDG